MNGLLLIDKPVGWTSFDVVAKVRGVLRQSSSNQSLVESQKGLKTIDYRLETRAPKVRVGHTGTLDPLASGLLILVIGSYTKRAQEFSKLDKTYEVELTLGATSETGDSEGPLVEVKGKRPDNREIEKILESFVGEIMQTPHAHSAIKINGQRAYKLARAGKEPKLEARKISIYDIRDLIIDYPKVWFTVDVSSGTYIRSLAEDLGNKLGCGAYLSALRRTKVGIFTLDQAITIDGIKDKLGSSLQSAD